MKDHSFHNLEEPHSELTHVGSPESTIEGNEAPRRQVVVWGAFVPIDSQNEVLVRRPGTPTDRETVGTLNRTRDGYGIFRHDRLLRVSDSGKIYDAVLGLVPGSGTHSYAEGLFYAEVDRYGELVPVSEKALPWIQLYDRLIDEEETLRGEWARALQEAGTLQPEIARTFQDRIHFLALQFSQIMAALAKEDRRLLGLFFDRFGYDLGRLARRYSVTYAHLSWPDLPG